MNKINITIICLFFLNTLVYGQRFQTSLSSDNNVLSLSLNPINGDFIELEFGQVEFFIRTSASSSAQIVNLNIDSNNFPGNIPLTLISDKQKGDYRIFHFGYSTTPSIVKKSYYERSSYDFVTIELSDVEEGEVFELVHDAVTYETYLNLTSGKGEDLAIIVNQDDEEEELEEEIGLFSGENRSKRSGLYTQATQIHFNEVEEAETVLYTTDNVSVDIYPNPVTDKVEVQIKAEQADKLKVSVQDINGQIIQIKMIEVNEGINQVQFNLKQLTSGTYFINAQSEDIKFSHKISVLH